MHIAMCPVLTYFPFSLRSLLIAMMNNTYNLISADALKYWCAVILFRAVPVRDTGVTLIT